jgi:DNA-binding NtrC family response regulator
VHDSDGSIAVSSELGAGSIFKVYLPRSSDGTETKRDIDRSLQIPGGAETILLVDDSAPLRELMREIFSVEGYSVLEASDGVQAVELSRKYPGIIHLLITDIVMPRMDGTALAEHLVQERPNIAVIFVTGYAANKSMMPHHPPERFTIIEKPYRPDALLQSARRMLGEMKSLPVTRG